MTIRYFLYWPEKNQIGVPLGNIPVYSQHSSASVGHRMSKTSHRLRTTSIGNIPLEDNVPIVLKLEDSGVYFSLWNKTSFSPSYLTTRLLRIEEIYYNGKEEINTFRRTSLYIPLSYLGIENETTEEGFKAAAWL